MGALYLKNMGCVPGNTGILWDGYILTPLVIDRSLLTAPLIILPKKKSTAAATQRHDSDKTRLSCQQKLRASHKTQVVPELKKAQSL